MTQVQAPSGPIGNLLTQLLAMNDDDLRAYYTARMAAGDQNAAFVATTALNLHQQNPATRPPVAATTPTAAPHTGPTLNDLPVTTPVDTTSPPTGTTPADQSAKGIIDTFLATYGLSSLGQTAWQWFLQGQSPDQIILSLRQTPEYNARFPAMADLSKQGHAISEGDYVNYERSIQQQNMAAGLPQGMYDTPGDIKNLLLNNVSPGEYQQRLQAYQTAVWQSPPEVRNALMNDYGLSAGQLTAFFIDPDKALPLIQRDLAAAQAQGTGVRTGYGDVGRDYAEHLADLGLTPDQLNTGFGNLVNQQQVIQGLPGQQPGIGASTAMQAQFDRNALAQQQMEAAQANVLNRFKQGGGPAANAQGIVGAGSTT